MKGVAFYVRVSTEKQAAEGYSLDAQIAECNKKAQEVFMKTISAEVYMDEGISGKEMTNRIALQRLLHDVRSGKIKTIITYKVSRLSRTLAESLQMVELFYDYGARFISVKEGEYGTPHGNLKFNILATVAQYQREELAENVKLGMTEKAKKGEWNGGIVIGYDSFDKKLNINPKEAEIVREIFDKYTEEKWGYKRIANYLNKRGYLTKKGNHFSIISVRDILTNPIYVGKVRFNQVVDWDKKRRSKQQPHETIIADGIHEPIINQSQWDKAEKIRLRKRTEPKTLTGAYPLTGFVKCPMCGSVMTSSMSRTKNGVRYRYYTCGKYKNKGTMACKPNSINAEKLEEQVFKQINNKLSQLPVHQLTENAYSKNDSFELIQQKLKQLNKQLSTYSTREENIKNAFETGFYSLEESQERMKRLTLEKEETSNKIEQLKEAIAFQSKAENQVTSTHIQFKTIEEIKNELPPFEFREFLQGIIEEIRVKDKDLEEIRFNI